MTPEPTASVIMTVRSEPLERVEAVLAALRMQDRLPLGAIEVVIATPSSDVAALRTLQPGGAVGRVVVIVNAGGRRSSGLNLAAAAASSEHVVRIDARSRPATDHVARCLEHLRFDRGIGVVGGCQVPLSGGRGVIARGIARALSNPWALGGASYRRPGRSGSVDTVYLGAFRRDELLALGGYDERLDANEDFDLCQRYRREGFTVWLEAGLVVGYVARTSLREVWAQYVAFGRSKVRYWRLSGARPNGRQLAALSVAALLVPAVLPLAVRPPLLAITMLLALPAFVVLDIAGGSGGGRPSVRMAASLCCAIVPLAWVAGVVAEVLRPAQISAAPSAQATRNLGPSTVDSVMSSEASVIVPDGSGRAA